MKKACIERCRQEWERLLRLSEKAEQLNASKRTNKLCSTIWGDRSRESSLHVARVRDVMLEGTQGTCAGPSVTRLSSRHGSALAYALARDICGVVTERRAMRAATKLVTCH